MTDAAANYVKVDCDATMFTTDVSWINVRDLIVILFGSKNLNIPFVSDLKTKRLYI